MKKVKIIVEFEPYEVDPDAYEETMSLNEAAEEDAESYETDPAGLLLLSIQKVKYKIVDE